MVRSTRSSSLALAALLVGSALSLPTLGGCDKEKPSKKEAAGNGDDDDAPKKKKKAKASDDDYAPKKKPKASDDDDDAKAGKKKKATSDDDDAPAKPAAAALKPGVGEMASVKAGATKKAGKTGPAIEAIEVDLTPVTVTAYKACVDDGTCKAPTACTNGTWGAKGKEKHPINCVSEPEAAAYCAWAGKRLPTADEFEYAALSSDGRKYPWGDKAATAWSAKSPVCWTNQGTCSVEESASGKNPFGLFDMMGNVSEWTTSQQSKQLLVLGSHWDGTTMGAEWSDFVNEWKKAVDVSAKEDWIGFRCVR